MKTRFPISILTLILLLTCCNLISQPLSGSYNVGSGQTYISLTRAGGFFSAVNARGLSGNVTVSITSNITNEDGSNSLNQWTETGAGRYTITIVPSAATMRTISGAPGTTLINLNGADRVTFDGRFGGSGKYFTFRNSNGANATFNFQNEARRNTITYCTIESNNQAALGTSGTIVFNTTTGTLGNDSNTISFCDIRDRSDAAGNSLCAIFANGTTTNSNTYNDYNTITNCNFYNTYSVTTTFVDMYLGDGNANWRITNNSIYQGISRLPSITSAYFCMIMATTGDNNLVSGNYFGGTAPNCGGTPMMFTGGGGIFGFRIWQVGTTTTSIVQNNTIANIDYTLTADGDYFFFKGIETNYSGKCDIIGNTVGSMSSTSSIILRYNAVSGNPYPAAINFGYYWYPGGSSCSGTVSGNNIGGISLTGSGTTTGNMAFSGIIAGFDPVYSSNGNVTITGNTIGSNIASNFQNTLNIRTTFIGINTNVNSPGSAIVTNNTIRNLTEGTTNATAVLRGIMHDGNGNFTATGNIIKELNTTSTNTSGLTGGSTSNTVAGILTGTNATGTTTISGNTISGLRSNAPGNINTSVKGINIVGNGTGTINANKIYDLTNISTGGGPAIFGLYDYSASMTVTNNQIGITNGEATDRKINPNPVPGINLPIDKNQQNQQLTKPITSGITSIQSPILVHDPTEENTDTKHGGYEIESLNGMIIQGIHDESSGTWNFYYNTVYIGGSVTSGASISSCYTRDFIAHPVTLKDNLFYNGRTGSGTHVVINNNITGSTITSNYNALVGSNNAAIGRWLGTNGTIAAWRTSSGGDNLSWSTLSSGISSTNLFNSISTGDFRINAAHSEAWIVSGKGIALATVNTDIEGNARATTLAGGCTDIGADEFAATPPGNPNAAYDNVPGSGITSTYTLWGRTIAVINWTAGATTYPTAVNIQYYSGVSPAGILGGNYSNSNWVVTPTGTLTNGKYDITYSIGDNETYTITSPNTNTRLAKYNSTWEVFSSAGTGVYQTELTWGNLTLKTRGLSTFSTYALTDVTSPLPVQILYFNAATDGRMVKLNWATEWEINNKGFNIERKSIITNGVSTEWQTAGYVEGHGNTTSQINYVFNDDKMATGSYQYRLRQIDFNGNFEYYDLNSPNLVTIGKPVSADVSQNYPNPSNPKSKIDYQIPFSAKVSIKVYDISGKEVASLVNEVKDAGFYTTEFDGTNVASGVYFYRILAEGDGQRFVNTKKMILVK